MEKPPHTRGTQEAAGWHEELRSPLPGGRQNARACQRHVRLEDAGPVEVKYSMN